MLQGLNFSPKIALGVQGAPATAAHGVTGGDGRQKEKENGGN